MIKSNPTKEKEVKVRYKAFFDMNVEEQYQAIVEKITSMEGHNFVSIASAKGKMHILATRLATLVGLNLPGMEKIPRNEPAKQFVHIEYCKEDILRILRNYFKKRNYGIVPILIDAYQKNNHPITRKSIINTIIELGLKESMDFLEEVFATECKYETLSARLIARAIPSLQLPIILPKPAEIIPGLPMNHGMINSLVISVNTNQMVFADWQTAFPAGTNIKVGLAQHEPEPESDDCFLQLSRPIRWARNGETRIIDKFGCLNRIPLIPPAGKLWQTGSYYCTLSLYTNKQWEQPEELRTILEQLEGKWDAVSRGNIDETGQNFKLLYPVMFTLE